MQVEDHSFCRSSGSCIQVGVGKGLLDPIPSMLKLARVGEGDLERACVPGPPPALFLRVAFILVPTCDCSSLNDPWSSSYAGI